MKIIIGIILGFISGTIFLAVRAAILELPPFDDIKKVKDYDDVNGCE